MAISMNEAEQAGVALGQVLLAIKNSPKVSAVGVQAIVLGKCLMGRAAVVLLPLSALAAMWCVGTVLEVIGKQVGLPKEAVIAVGLALIAMV